MSKCDEIFFGKFVAKRQFPLALFSLRALNCETVYLLSISPEANQRRNFFTCVSYCRSDLFFY